MFDNESSQKRLSIGQFAQLSLISVKALRLYHQKALLEPAMIDPFTGYRYYLKVQLNDARLIRMMRQMEMPLALINKLMGIIRENPAEAEAVILDYQHAFQKRQKFVDDISEQLLSYLNNKEFEMTLKVNQVKASAQVVVSVAKNVTIAELDQFIEQTIGRLHQFVEGQNGTLAGAPFGIYHGQINDNGDTGPLEVCLPVSQLLQGDGDVEVKEFGAVNTAVVDMHGADCDFPAILKAYDATSDWIVKHGHEIVDSPREVWFSAPGEDAHMQIHWPYK